MSSIMLETPRNNQKHSQDSINKSGLSSSHLPPYNIFLLFGEQLETIHLLAIFVKFSMLVQASKTKILCAI